MRTSRLTFDDAATVLLPRALAHHVIGSRHLFIAPDVPAWIVTDEPGAEVIWRLSRGATVSAGLDVFRSHGMTPADARDRLRQLLVDIHLHNFLDGAVVDDQKSYARLQVHVTNRCNLRCGHCYVSSGVPHEHELSLDDWREVLDVMREAFTQVHVAISGGEPLTVPWLGDLLDYAKVTCGFDTALITNGLLWTPSKVERLVPNLDYVAVSLDGATASTHDALRGPGTFDRTLRAVRLIGESGLRVVLNVTMRRSNREDLIANLDGLVSDIPFAVDVDISNFITEGRGTATPHESLAHREFLAALSQVVSTFLADDYQAIPLSRRYNCGYGSAFAVYADGDVSPCLSPVFIRGNVRTDGVRPLFSEILREAEAASVDRLPLCRSCDVRYLCGGRCHLNHFRHTRRMVQNDCPSSYRRQFYEGLIARFDAINESTAPALDRPHRHPSSTARRSPDEGELRPSVPSGGVPVELQARR